MKPVSLLAVLLLVLSTMLFVPPSSLAAITYTRIDTLVPPGKLITSFDISWVDRSTKTYYLADRTNAGVDQFDAGTDAFLFRFSGFVGFTGDNDTSGPDGVVVVHPEHELWAGDGNSTVKVFDLRSRQLVATIPTGGKKRADELAFDPADHLVLVANDAEDTPFVSLISVKTRTVVAKIEFSAANGVDATNGIEQPLWDPVTHRFFVAVPQIGPDPANGGIVVINPDTLRIETIFPVSQCQPHGLALGPIDLQHILLGCSGDAIAAGFKARSIVMSARDGAIVTTIFDVGGSDEVWFNPGDKRYYLAANNNPGGPVFGVIDAVTDTFITNVRTGANAHSIAVDPINNHVFVPIRGVGIAVFAQTGQ